MNLRDRFWRAFWLRQQKHLPPAARFNIEKCHLWVDSDATQPAINIEVGRTWKSPDA